MRSLLLAFVLAAPLLAQDPAAHGWSEARVRRLCHELAEDALEEGGVGFSIAVGFGPRVVHAGGYGLAELEHGAPAGVDTMFRIGSVTKQFTSALVMKRVEDGRLALDDSIATLLPDVELHGHTVTLRQLLNHTSGIKSYTGLGAEWMKIVSLELDHQEMIALFEDEPFDFEPGTDWRYNNSGYYLLGMLLERAEREKPRLRDRYARLVKRELTDPLGLARTRYDSNSELIEDRAQGYGVALATTNDRLIGMSQPGAAGALLSTARDLVRWQQALVGGRVVSPESYAAMTRPTVLIGGREQAYGFGLGMGERDGHAVVQHGGGIFGFNSMLAYFPDQALHVAVISNSEAASSQALAQAIAQALLAPAPEEEALEPDPSYTSPRLGLLAAELARDPGVLEEFWREVQGHAPLVEPTGEPGWVTVTYLWRDGESARVGMFGGQEVGREKPLARLGDTDLWFRSEVLSTRARFTYAFMPQQPLKQPGSWEEMLALYEAHPPQPDPLGARTFGLGSALELADAPAQPWIAAREGVPRGELVERSLHSELLDTERALHVYTPPGYEQGHGGCDLVLLFDGEVYGGVEPAYVPTNIILDNLAHERLLGPTLVVLVHSGDTRTQDLGQSEAYADFIATELIPWMRARYRVSGDPARVVLGGSSLGGLQATFTALRHPGIIGGVISQSGSYWWTGDASAAITGRAPMSSGSLIEQVAQGSGSDVRFWMEVGLYEGAGAMLGPNRHLRDLLRLKGHDVLYREFVGGHDYFHWRGSLGEALVALLGR